MSLQIACQWNEPGSNLLSRPMNLNNEESMESMFEHLSLRDDDLQPGLLADHSPDDLLLGASLVDSSGKFSMLERENSGLQSDFHFLSDESHMLRETEQSSYFPESCSQVNVLKRENETLKMEVKSICMLKHLLLEMRTELGKTREEKNNLDKVVRGLQEKLVQHGINPEADVGPLVTAPVYKDEEYVRKLEEQNIELKMNYRKLLNGTDEADAHINILEKVSNLEDAVNLKEGEIQRKTAEVEQLKKDLAFSGDGKEEEIHRLRKDLQVSTDICRSLGDQMQDLKKDLEEKTFLFEEIKSRGEDGGGKDGEKEKECERQLLLVQLKASAEQILLFKDENRWLKEEYHREREQKNVISKNISEVRKENETFRKELTKLEQLCMELTNEKNRLEVCQKGQEEGQQGMDLHEQLTSAKRYIASLREENMRLRDGPQNDSYYQKQVTKEVAAVTEVYETNKEELQKLGALYKDVTSKNFRWQEFSRDQESYIHQIEQDLAKKAVDFQHLQTFCKMLNQKRDEEAMKWKAERISLLALQNRIQGEMEKARHMLVQRIEQNRQRTAEEETVEILQQQLKVYEADFKQEREDREALKAQNNDLIDKIQHLEQMQYYQDRLVGEAPRRKINGEYRAQPKSPGIFQRMFGGSVDGDAPKTSYYDNFRTLPSDVQADNVGGGEYVDLGIMRAVSPPLSHQERDNADGREDIIRCPSCMMQLPADLQEEMKTHIKTCLEDLGPEEEMDLRSLTDEQKTFECPRCLKEFPRSEKEEFERHTTVCLDQY